MKKGKSGKDKKAIKNETKSGLLKQEKVFTGSSKNRKVKEKVELQQLPINKKILHDLNISDTSSSESEVNKDIDLTSNKKIICNDSNKVIQQNLINQSNINLQLNQPFIPYNPYISSFRPFQQPALVYQYPLVSSNLAIPTTIPIGSVFQNQSIKHIKTDKENKIRKNDQYIEESNFTEEDTKYNINYIIKNRNLASDLQNPNLYSKIRQLLPQCNQQEYELIFKEILATITDLFTNAYANYFIQDFIPYLDRKSIQRIWKRVFTKIEYYCCADYSTHCVQVLIEKTENPKDQEVIMSHIEPSFYIIATNKRGTHVIKKLIETLNGKAKESIIHKLNKYFNELCQDKYGNNLIKMLILINKNKENSSFINKITKNLLLLSCDIYGNYIYLYILETWNPNSLSPLFDEISLNLKALCCDKFGSRIILKILEIQSSVSF